MNNEITIQEGFEVDPETFAHIYANYYLPGEKVKLDASVKLFNDNEDKLYGEQEFVISETRLSPGDNGTIFINYVFDEITGIHNALAFMNPEGYAHQYGSLITRENQSWLVPFSGDHENPVAGVPLIINSNMTRSGLHCFCIDGIENTVEGYLSGHEEQPSIGEYYIIPCGNNHWTLNSSPWMSDASQKEIALAEQSIEDYLLETRPNIK